MKKILLTIGLCLLAPLVGATSKIIPGGSSSAAQLVNDIPCADGELMVWSDGPPAEWVCAANAAGGASTALGYITKTAEASLSNELALGGLATGLLINTTATGIPTILSAQSCTNQFVRSYNASGTATCATVATTDLASGATIDTEWDTVAEFNAASTDDDFVTLLGIQTLATGTKTVTSKFDFGGGTVEVPNSNTLPASCAVGDAYMDTDASTGNRFYLCESANTWALQGDDGGSGSGDVLSVGNCSSGDCLDGTSDGGTAISIYSAGGVVTLGNVSGGATFDTDLTIDGIFTSNSLSTNRFEGPVSAPSFTSDDPGDGLRAHIMTTNTAAIGEGSAGTCSLGFVGTDLRKHCNGGALTSVGSVVKVGTPLDNQVGIWTGDGTIEGDADMTFTGNSLTVVGNVAAGTLNGHTFTTGSSTFTGTAAQTYTFPTTTSTLARTSGTNTFSGVQTIATGNQLKFNVIGTNGSAAMTGTGTIAGDPTLQASEVTYGTTGFIFEGATADLQEMLLTPADPGADVTVTIPATTGTLALIAGDLTTGSVLTAGAIDAANLFNTALCNGGNQILRNNAGTWECADTPSGATVALDDLSDATISAPATGALLVKSAGDWVNSAMNLADTDAVGTSILAAGNGGTGNAFTAFTGPATSIKTFTLPNASASILTTFANITVPQGGTGFATVTDGGILLGNGAGALVALGVATNGQIPIGDGTTDPQLGTISGTTNEIEITNGAGTIQVGIPTSPTITGAVTMTSTLDGGTSADFDGAVTAPSFSAEDSAVAPGNLIRIQDNDTGLTPDPTCANSGTADQLTLLDVNEAAGDEWRFCAGTANLAPVIQTQTCDLSVIAPASATHDALYKCYIPNAATLVRAYCYTTASTYTINLFERTEAAPGTSTTELLTADLVCDTGGEATTSFADAALAADSLLTINLQTAGPLAGNIGVHIEYTVN